MTNTVSDVVSDDTLNRIIQIESGGNPNAKAATSSALGLGQFLKATWLGQVRTSKPAWAKGLNDTQLLAFRTDPCKSIEMLGDFTEANALSIGSTRGGDIYLAHFLGAATARNVCKANPAEPVVKIVGDDAVEANKSIMRNKSCGQVRQWAADVMARKTPAKDWIAEYYHTDEEPEEELEPAEKGTPVEDDTALVPDNDTDEDDPTPHGQTNGKIKKLQQDLDDMGYHEVGVINGRWGGGTKGALAAFMNDRGIDDPVDMRQSNLDAIQDAITDGFQRPASDARKNVTAKELAPHNETIKQGLRAKAAAFWTGVSTFALGIGSSIMNQFSYYWDKLALPRKLIGDVPLPVWAIIVCAICGGVWYFNRGVVNDTTQKFRDRKLLQ